MDFMDSNYHWKNWVDKKRYGNLKNLCFEKKDPKVKKHDLHSSS